MKAVQLEFQAEGINGPSNLARLSKSLILAKQFLIDAVGETSDEVEKYELELLCREIDQIVSRVKVLRDLQNLKSSVS